MGTAFVGAAMRAPPLFRDQCALLLHLANNMNLNSLPEFLLDGLKRAGLLEGGYAVEPGLFLQHAELLVIHDLRLHLGSVCCEIVQLLDAAVLDHLLHAAVLAVIGTRSVNIGFLGIRELLQRDLFQYVVGLHVAGVNFRQNFDILCTPGPKFLIYKFAACVQIAVSAENLRGECSVHRSPECG